MFLIISSRSIHSLIITKEEEEEGEKKKIKDFNQLQSQLQNWAKDYLYQQCSVRCYPCLVVCKKIFLFKNKLCFFEV